MSEYHVRTDLSAPLPMSPDVRVLDWAPDRSAATIQLGERAGARFFDGWVAPREALDLMLLGASVYCADKTSRRDAAADVWTRDLTIEVPVNDADAWGSAGWDPVLNFLTGDRWSVIPRHAVQSPVDGLRRAQEQPLPVADFAAVSLFSGGLDSLTGVIDLLEDDSNSRICLLSHHEGGQASTAQHALLSALQAHYGSERIEARSLFLRPAPPNGNQARPLPADRETTTRARSFLFLTSALALAASAGPDVPVYIPENGFIGINVPLTRARAGSFSTRTTHPHYINSLQESARRVGVRNPIVNPFRLSTKGEILHQSTNPDLLERLAPLSVSCSHPEAARYAKRAQGNCGYCFPCLIRRSSMATVGWDDGSQYAWDALTGTGLLDTETERAKDLRAVINGVYAERPDREVFRNGPIPDREHRAFLRVWRSGLDELRTWFEGSSELTAAVVEGLR